MASLDRIEIVQAIGEAAYGVNPGLAVTDAIIAYGLEWTINKEVYRRKLIDNFARPAPRAPVVGKLWNGASFDIELRGSSAALEAAQYPAPHHFYQAAGLEGTFDAIGPPTNQWEYVTPNRLDEGSIPGLSLRAFLHDLQMELNGGRCDLTWKFPHGGVPTLSVSVSGLYVRPVAGATPTPDYTTGTTGLKDVTPPIFVGAVAGWVPYGDTFTAVQPGHIRNLEITLRNQIATRESANVGAHGVAAFVIEGRGTKEDPGVAVSFEVEQQAAEGEWWERFLDGELDTAAANLDFLVGTDVGNIVKFSMGGLAIQNLEQIRMEGRWGHKVDARLMGTGAAAEDDFSILHY